MQILGNIGQVRERGASIIVVSCVENLESKIDISKIPFLIQLQPVKSLFAALQACSALQMIAYYSSLARGLNPDQQVFDAIDKGDEGPAWTFFESILRNSSPVLPGAGSSH